MKFFVHSTFVCILAGLFLSATGARAQEVSPEEQQKKMYEYIEKETERLETTLKLEDWQVFFVDSILTHDLFAMQDEMKGLQTSKVENYDIYITTQDKWQEKIYNAYRKVFNDEQWKKYLKSGAERDKRNRDKRKTRREGMESN